MAARTLRSSTPLAFSAAALLAAALALLATGCSPGAAQTDGTQEMTAKGTADSTTGSITEAPVRVSTLALLPTSFEERIQVSGTIAPHREVTVASELGGFVRELGFEKGQRVSRGRVLARIGDDLASARLDRAKAELKAAEANFVKISKLAERQAVPKQDLVQATAQRDSYLAQVKELELLLERAIVRAPVSGVAITKDVERGEIVGPGAQIAILHDLSRLKLEANVPDTEIGWLSEGTEAQVQVDAFEDQAFPATLTYVAPSADPTTRTFPIELVVPNKDGKLRPGLLARVSLSRRSVENAIVVPIDAMLPRASGTVAFVAGPDCTASLREVKLGAAEGASVHVLSGLEADDQLIVEGQRDLVDGQRVLYPGCE